MSRDRRSGPVWASRGLAVIMAVGAAGLSAQDGEPRSGSSVRLFGVVEDESLPLRCFPTEESPVYEDILTQGQPVLLGDTYPPSFRQVFLPIGVTGYVHKNFVTELALEGEGAGTVRTNEDGVSWRFRPQQAGEPPIGRLPGGSVLFVLAEEGDWYRVRQPEQVGWVHEAEVKVVDPPTPTIERAWADMEARHRKVATDLVAGKLAAVVHAEEAAARRTALDDLRVRFRAEQQKQPVDQKLEAIASGVEAFLDGLPEGAELEPAAARLKREVADQIWLRDSIILTEEEVKPVEAAAPVVKAPVDPLARFDAVGWLKHYPSNELGRRFSVEKGEQVLFWVTCSSGRYDLDAFINTEVGVVGPDHRPTAESLRILDAQRIEVLSPRQTRRR